MKRFFALFLMLLAFHASAGILVGNLSPIVTAYTNSAPIQTNMATVPLPQVTMSNNALSATNSYGGLFRFSLDGVNWFTNGSPITYPTATGAGSTTVLPYTLQIPIQVEFVAYTNAANTSTINFGATTP